MPWPTKTIKGTAYSFTHLAPFVMPVKATPTDAATYQLRVSFGFHTVTRAREPAHTPDMFMSQGNDHRSLCIERHALSLQLPQLIRYAAAGKAFFSNENNYIIVERQTHNGVVVPYAVFFDVRQSANRKTHDVAMTVVSAYLKAKLPKRLDTIKFATLVSKIARGEKVVRPK